MNKITRKFQITIPKKIREKLNLNIGSPVEFKLNEDGTITVIPLKLIPADQAWFWSEEWQKIEREADEDIKEGRVKEFENIEDLIKDLNS